MHLSKCFMNLVIYVSKLMNMEAFMQIVSFTCTMPVYARPDNTNHAELSAWELTLNSPWPLSHH